MVRVRTRPGSVGDSISSVHSDGGSCTDTSSLERTTTPDGTVLESHISQWRSLLGGLLLRKKRRIMRLSTFPQAMQGLCFGEEELSEFSSWRGAIKGWTS
ncbi:hypothetical protein HPP92_028082 [Vanilla planifolia]|uniref:Uncharacterized protein n=1 Tax=Vanilla planifolia TaxID=51239 RepID=A0A835P6W7_VANPL|nr:hypothetical protein HPP92_028082 [Vanilla planifolia]